MSFSLVSKYARSLAMLPLPWHHVNLFNINDIQPFMRYCLIRNASHVRVLRAFGNRSFLGTGHTWELILPRMANLNYLDLSGVSNVDNVRFLKYLPKLQHLMLDDFRGLTRENFVTFKDWPQRLVFFSFVRNYQCTEKELVVASKFMPLARAIDIQFTGYLSPREATEICQNCPNLTGFFFTNYFYVSDRKKWQEFAKTYSGIRFSCSFNVQMRMYANYPDHPQIAPWQA